MILKSSLPETCYFQQAVSKKNIPIYLKDYTNIYLSLFNSKTVQLLDANNLEAYCYLLNLMSYIIVTCEILLSQTALLVSSGDQL